MTTNHKEWAAQLRKAKKYLEGHAPCYYLGVCECLEATEGTGKTVDIRWEIARRLHPWHARFVSAWLREAAGIADEDLTPENMRLYRLRWIDAMIEEFEQ